MAEEQARKLPVWWTPKLGTACRLWALLACVAGSLCFAEIPAASLRSGCAPGHKALSRAGANYRRWRGICPHEGSSKVVIGGSQVRQPHQTTQRGTQDKRGPMDTIPEGIARCLPSGKATLPGCLGQDRRIYPGSDPSWAGICRHGPGPGLAWHGGEDKKSWPDGANRWLMGSPYQYCGTPDGARFLAGCHTGGPANERYSHFGEAGWQYASARGSGETPASSYVIIGTGSRITCASRGAQSDACTYGCTAWAWPGFCWHCRTALDCSSRACSTLHGISFDQCFGPNQGSGTRAGTRSEPTGKKSFAVKKTGQRCTGSACSHWCGAGSVPARKAGGQTKCDATFRTASGTGHFPDNPEWPTFPFQCSCGRRLRSGCKGNDHRDYGRDGAPRRVALSPCLTELQLQQDTFVMMWGFITKCACLPSANGGSSNSLCAVAPGPGFSTFLVRRQFCTASLVQVCL